MPAVAALLSVVVMLGVVSTVTLYIVSALGPVLVVEFDLSRAAYGSLSTAMFVVAMVVSPLAGRIERLASPRAILLATVLTGSLALLALVGAIGYAALVTAMVMAGVSVGMSNPVANTLIARGASREWHSRLVTSKQMSSQVGALACGLGVPALASVVGWRLAALAPLVVSMLGLVLVLRMRIATSPGEPVDPMGRGPASRPAAEILQVLVPYAMLMGFGYSATLAFAPLYGFEVLGLRQSIAGAATGVIGGAGIASRVYWSWYTDRSPSPARPLAALAALSCAAIMLLLVAGLAPFAVSALYWTAVVLVGFTTGAWTTICMIVVVRSCRTSELARTSGIVMTYGFAGIVTGPFVLGALVDGIGRYGPGWAVVAGLYGIASLASMRAARLGASPVS